MPDIKFELDKRDKVENSTDWEQIEKDFFKFIMKTWCPTHDRILEWFKNKFKEQRAKAFSNGYDAGIKEAEKEQIPECLQIK